MLMHAITMIATITKMIISVIVNTFLVLYSSTKIMIVV